MFDIDVLLTSATVLGIAYRTFVLFARPPIRPSRAPGHGPLAEVLKLEYLGIDYV